MAGESRRLRNVPNGIPHALIVLNGSKEMTTPSPSCSLLIAVLLITGCSGEPEPYRKPTSVVTGQVLVDGVPVPVDKPMKVLCHNVEGIDTEHPTVSTALTGEDGKFSISTYEKGDGVPAGGYVVTFFWGELNLMAASYVGPDKLKGKYSDPTSSEFMITVVEGLPTDMGTIELTTAE